MIVIHGAFLLDMFLRSVQWRTPFIECGRVPKCLHKRTIFIAWRTLSCSAFRDQHHAEPRFPLHHAGVSISGLFEGSCLDHRADILQDAEGKDVLSIDWRAAP